jgi:hypothetical protein
MEEKKAWVGTLLLVAVIGVPLFFVVKHFRDRNIHIFQYGEITTAQVTDVSLVCRRGIKGVTYTYSVGGVAYKEGDQVDCDWEVPQVVEIAYLPEDPSESKVMYGYRYEHRQNAAR